MYKTQILEFINKKIVLWLIWKYSINFFVLSFKRWILELYNFKFYYELIIQDKNKLEELMNILFNYKYIELKGIDIILNYLLMIFYFYQFKNNECFKNLYIQQKVKE